MLPIFISAAFFLANVSLNYIFLFTQSAKIIQNGTLPLNYYDFDILYLFKVTTAVPMVFLM